MTLQEASRGVDPPLMVAPGLWRLTPPELGVRENQRSTPLLSFP